MAEIELKELCKKRASFKGRITAFVNYLNGLPSTLTEPQVNELQLRLNKLELIYQNYDEVQLKIECVSDDIQASLTERNDVENIYYHTSSIAQDVLCKHHEKCKSLASEKSSSRANHHLVKLPTIQLPKFHGSYENWLEFRDTYTSLIHSNDDIDNINKFHYLRASLEGTAAVVIQSIEFSANNYEIAWNLLCDRFNNKRLLVQNHVNALFNLESITKESSHPFKRMIDQLNKNIRSLESLGEPVVNWDTLLIHIVTHKLDSKTFRGWEEFKSSLDKEKPIPLSKLLGYLQDRADLLETLESSRDHATVTSIKHTSRHKTLVTVSDVKSNYLQKSNDNTNQYSYASQKPCPKCHGEHHLYNCAQFLSLNTEQRLKLLPGYRICFNCFRIGHYANNCRKPGCKICKRKHHTLIHVADKSIDISNITSGFVENSTVPKNSFNPSTNLTLSASVAAFSNHSQEVLLSTALVKVYDAQNREHIARAILDSGSTSSLITDRLCSILNLPVKRVQNSIIGVNNKVSPVGHTCIVVVKSQDETFTGNINCFVLPTITDNIPCHQVKLSDFNIPSDINLADPTFYMPSAIDMIIGADIFWDLLGSHKINLGQGKPTLYETRLGWLVTGPVGIVSADRVICNFTKASNKNVSLDDDIQTQLTQFWQLDEVGFKSSYYSKEETLCEEHFSKNTTRLANGRFCVRIPLKAPMSELGNSFNRAHHCFCSLERRLKGQHSFKEYYSNFMSEYISLGHMSEYHFNSQKPGYFLPHHGVLREASSTTKLRVVFNASSPTTSGVSLNGIQLVGATIQDDLLSILLRYRCYKIVLAADVEKMYRQILVHPDDRNLQQIIWRSDSTEPLKCYRLNTVTYGTASAPFLATRCLKQLGLDCCDSKLSDIIIHDFYVDDLLSGGDTLEEVLDIKQRVTTILASGCMNLRKWKSNAPEVLINDSENSLVLDLHMSAEPNKTLGLTWFNLSDELCFSINVNDTFNLSKRTILSVIAQIFDPLGLLAPCIITLKLLLQSLWLCRLAWDDRLPSGIAHQWAHIINGFPTLNNLRVPRRVVCDGYKYIELHLFTDASQKAYGACAYLRSGNEHSEVRVRLLLAKSRVAPIKVTTIPRLELCGALMGVRLYEKIISAFRVPITSTTFWTDSTIVLGWLKMHPNKMQPFVRNRVSEILDKSNGAQWRHVPTDQNPADLITRGINSELIRSCDLWWSGPEYLKHDVSQWPTTPGLNEILPEIRSEVTLHAITKPFTNVTSFIDFSRFSNYLRLIRTVGYVLRFVSFCKTRHIQSICLNAEELNASTLLLAKISQQESFPEYSYLSKHHTLPKKSQLLKYNVFLDDHQLMRVGGRLFNSDFLYDKKHPILLQSTHIFTKLLFAHEHKALIHAGPQQLLASIRERYWPIGGRNLAKLCFHQCIKCRRIRGKTVAPLMGNLPQHRLVPGGYPFEYVGVDYAGPILSASRQGRGCKVVKVYIAIFVCFTTKAMHIELVGDLTSKNYLSALRRFISRRGKPAHIYSDNGTSFVGASNELGKFLKNNCNSWSEAVANQTINFHFTPAYAPHFGGLWEAGVKSVKAHLYRVLGNCYLTYEELNTVLIQIEAILNSRPITPLSSDPEDFSPLTPGYFLIGRPLLSLPGPDLRESNITYLSRHQRIEAIRQHFWIRWSKEYVSELQQRIKWRTSNNPLKIGALVIIKEDNLPPLKWRLGRIIQVHPGLDGISRVADVKTSGGVLRRSFAKMCPLMNSDEDQLG